MVSAINSALSGLNAANVRMENAAVNLANQQTTGFKPQDAVQTSQAVGGVQTELRTRENPSVKLYDPEASNADEEGFSEQPNVDPAQEIVNFKAATYDFKANLKSLKMDEKTNKDLLNIIT